VNPLALIIPPDLRFSCHRCGACCRDFSVGLDPGEAERIARHDWTREGERFRDGFVLRTEDEAGKAEDELRKRPDGSCVFLDDDGLCLVEKRLGREAKPRICRKFPFVFVSAPDGPRACVSVECVSRWRSLEDGAPVEAARGELAALLARSSPHLARSRVRVAAGGRVLGPAEYLALEARLLTEAEEPRPLEATLTALATAIAEAERGIEGSVEASWDPEPAAEPLAALLAESRAEPFDAALARVLRPVAAAADGRGGPRGPACAALQAAPGAWRDALAAVDATPASSAFVRALLRGWIEEAIPARNPTAEDGVGQLILGALLTAALVREIARDAGAGADRPPPASLNYAAREVSLFFRGYHARRLHELLDELQDAPTRPGAPPRTGLALLCRAAAAL
jgi:Fe-S-cluster containining protein